MTQTERLARIAELEKQVSTLSSELCKLNKDECDYKSREFIRVNKITKADVFSVAVCKQWIGIFALVGPYISKHGINARYVEWNGKLYCFDDVMCGRMNDTPAYYEHVPEVTT